MTHEEIDRLLREGRKLAIATQAWSRGREGNPGAGNYHMARIASELARQYDLPIIAQVEVADALGRDHCAYVVDGSGDDGMSGMDWNTFTVVTDQADYCRRRRIDTVIVIAGPFHLGRTIWCWEKTGIVALAGPQKALSVYQDPCLVHPQARSPIMLPLAIAWEAAARLFFLQKGWM